MESRNAFHYAVNEKLPKDVNGFTAKLCTQAEDALIMRKVSPALAANIAHGLEDLLIYPKVKKRSSKRIMGALEELGEIN